MNPDTLPAVWTFVQVVEMGSMSSAARVLGVTPSAVSKQLSRLEKHLGTRLLNRTTRRVRPTEEGMTLYDRCRPLFDAFSEVEESVRAMRSSLSGRLRVTATPALGRALLVPAVGEFANMHPDLDFELIFTAQRLDLVEEGIDVALREGPLPDSSLIGTKLTEARILLCASPEYLARRSMPVDLGALPEHDIVSVPAVGSGNESQQIRLPGRERLELRPRILVNDLLSVRALALDGRGIAPLPDYMVERDLVDAKLVQVLPDSGLPRLPVFAIYPERRFQPTRSGAFLEFLVARFRRMPERQRSTRATKRKKTRRRH